MIESPGMQSTAKPLTRCAQCDREATHYNTFVQPNDEQSVVCWECLERLEKGFNADRGFHRVSRGGLIPR